MNVAPKRYVISVLVADRVGILRDITAAMTDMGGNIDGISQTVVAGYFTVILTVTFEREVLSREIEKAIMLNFPSGEASVLVRPYERRARTPPAAGERYVITLAGKDCMGILKAVTAFFAERNVNIEDWYVSFDPPNVMHAGEVTLPALLDMKQFQDEFRRIVAPPGDGRSAHKHIPRHQRSGRYSTPDHGGRQC